MENKEEQVEVVKDAEIETVAEQEDAQTESVEQKRNPMVRMVLLFILGILLGVVVKTEASKNITMGYSDYKVTSRDLAAYDINAIQRDLAAKGADPSIASGTQGLQGGTCEQ